MKITLNMSEADVSFIDGRLLEYQTRSSYIRDILRGHIRNTGGLAVGIESKVGAVLGKVEELHKTPVVLVTPVAPVKAPLPIDTRTELEKMPPAARAAFERTIAARKAERAAAEAQRTMTIEGLSPEKQDAIRRAVAVEVARIGGGITDTYEVAEARESVESRESSEDDNGYLTGETNEA